MDGHLRRAASCILLLIAAPGGCTSLRHGDSFVRYDGTSWGTTWSLVVESHLDFRGRIQGHLDAWGTVLSTYQAGSEINQLNAMPVGTSRRVSGRMQKALSLSLELCRRSGGIFDPLLGRPMIAHGFEPDVRNAHGERSSGSLEAALPGRLHCEGFDLADQIFTRKTRDLLNLNAIAEGLAMQEIADDLRARGVGSFLFELGGEVIAGEAPARRPQGWWVGIESARTGRSLQTFSIQNAALSTSGTYRNVRGVHSHLIGPTGGRPIPAGPKSASALCDRADTADGLATILAVAPLEKAPDLLRAFSGCEAFIQSGHRLWHSAQWPARRSLPEPTAGP